MNIPAIPDSDSRPISVVVSSLILVFALTHVIISAPWIAAGAVGLNNGSFEDGDDAPEGWRRSGGECVWEAEGHTGPHSISIAGDGKGSDFWSGSDLPFEPLTLYRVSFWSKISPGTTGGCALTGTDAVNRDFHPSIDWERRSFIFRTPVETGSINARFGGWHIDGKVWFDDIDFTRIRPVHEFHDGVRLGSGERIQDGVYIFESDFGWEGSNYSRPLYKHTAGFNSNRWKFTDGSYVIYRHRTGPCKQTSGEVEVNSRYFATGECRIYASRDGRGWTLIGKMTGAERKKFSLPPEIYPAWEIFIKFEAVGRYGIPARLQVHEYIFRSALLDAHADQAGETFFIEESTEISELSVEMNCGPDPSGNRGYQVDAKFRLADEGFFDRELSMTAEFEGRRYKAAFVRSAANRTAELRIPVERGGEHSLELAIRGKDATLYTGSVNLYTPQLYASGYGRLLSSCEKCDTWWTDSTRKTGRRTPAPVIEAPEIAISAAGNEYEPFQVVLLPKSRLENIVIEVSDLNGPRGSIPEGSISIRHVGYVPVKAPTDKTGAVDSYPDPLLPYEGPFDIEPGFNHPLWFLIHVPKGTPCGDYLGRIEIKSPGCGWSEEIDMKLHVWNFDLPDEPRVRSGFGLSVKNIEKYHHIRDEAKLADVLDKYYRSFREHRISPYFPMAPIEVSFKGPEGVEDPLPEQIEMILDFNGFDRTARKYLDEFRFTSFRLPLTGMTKAASHYRKKGKLGGYEIGDSRHESLFKRYVGRIQEHLEVNGWLEKALIYWYDEPKPGDYECVKEGMDLISKAGPKMTRMLTEEPVPELYGYVDIWCPQTSKYKHDIAEKRREHGDRFWWYLCTGPKTPYCTLFIDHPAVELRMWLWQTWKYNIEGILVWQTAYWTSSSAYPDGLQNPYEDPMSYQESHRLPPGFTGYLGNGDGRFLYPPKRTFETGGECLDGPVESIRWEMLREGIEDYDYLAILQEEVDRLRGSAFHPGEPGLAKEAAALLNVPPEICADMTEFSLDPELLFERRSEIARMIERLIGSHPQGLQRAHP